MVDEEVTSNDAEVIIEPDVDEGMNDGEPALDLDDDEPIDGRVEDAG